MISINTNISSFIAQNSLKTSTNKLNETIERMSSGYKINHAKDNAANYSISTNMTTQLNSYHVAQDNIAMGMDLVTTASDTISLMQNKAERLRALCTQARNGTYGAQSMNAINGEANAIIAEINRIYMNAEYNGIKFFELANVVATAEAEENAGAGARAVNNMPEAKYNGFIENPTTYSQSYVDSLTALSTETDSFTKTEYKIASVDDLVKLAELVNNCNDSTGITFILAKDLNLKEYCEANIGTGGWTPIGEGGNGFTGTFDGNGHVISDVIIDGRRGTLGLFGDVLGTIKNLGVKNTYISSINAESIGALVGYVDNGSVLNCYATGYVSTQDSTTVIGGLIGVAVSSTITCNYADVNVNGIGTSLYGDIYGVGGLVGTTHASNLDKNYATGNVSGDNFVGGLVGGAQYGTTIANCYATGDVSATYYNSGGLIGGLQNSTISNSYATGTVESEERAGGLAGSLLDGTITDSYATGNVTATYGCAGGLVGALGSESSPCSISCSYAYGTVTGPELVGSLVGALVNLDGSTNTANFSITNCQTVAQACDPIGGFTDGNTMVPIVADLTPLLAGITVLAERPTLGSGTGSTGAGINLQVGIYGNQSCGITLNTGFSYDLSALTGGIESDGALQAIDDFINLLSDKATHFGAVQNRLESALDSIEVNIMNLTSSRSTIRDADMAELSSTYIQQQILQEASATLMATANQMPAIALQLLQVYPRHSRA